MACDNWVNWGVTKKNGGETHPGRSQLVKHRLWHGRVISRPLHPELLATWVWGEGVGVRELG